MDQEIVLFVLDLYFEVIAMGKAALVPTTIVLTAAGKRTPFTNKLILALYFPLGTNNPASSLRFQTEVTDPSNWAVPDSVNRFVTPVASKTCILHSEPAGTYADRVTDVSSATSKALGETKAS